MSKEAGWWNYDGTNDLRLFSFYDVKQTRHE